MDNSRFAGLLSEFVQSTPPEIIQAVIGHLSAWDSSQHEYHQAKLFASIHAPQVKFLLSRLLNCWQVSFPGLPPIGLALSLESSLRVLQAAQKPQVELVWTGPAIQYAHTRRINQALIELIDGAKERILLVSFAVYKAKTIIHALEEALHREVKVLICLEDSEENQGKVAYSGLQAFSSSLFRLATFYHWPLENRPHSPEGRYGSLHAKLAVADRNTVLISSANLTDSAMDLNLEMGILLEDERIGRQVDDLFEEMMVQGILREVLN